MLKLKRRMGWRGRRRRSVRRKPAAGDPLSLAAEHSGRPFVTPGVKTPCKYPGFINMTRDLV